MPSWLLADLLVAFHVAYVAYVVLLVPAVIAGGFCRWRWVKNSWVRNIHLVMIGIVVVESLVGIPCPLTVWETDLRQSSGQETFDGSFIGHWLHELLFFDFSETTFMIIYVSFGVLVALLYVTVPPNWLERRLRPRTANP